MDVRGQKLGARGRREESGSWGWGLESGGWGLELGDWRHKDGGWGYGIGGWSLVRFRGGGGLL